jgi:ADP-ribose pyrophosphatase YjhB (NUDIX family)/predicted transcriptional regulator
MINLQLHPIEVSILTSLRRSDGKRYSDLLHAASAENDLFKSHLRKLVDTGSVEKVTPGHYRLTSAGKEFANNLDRKTRSSQKQPKLSLFLVVSRKTKDTTEYLFQERLRNPYYGYWGNISGPAKWGQQFEDTARAELQKQTGLTAEFAVNSFFRATDYDAASDELLEDKLFIVMTAQEPKGKLSNEWSGGYNAWMTLDTFDKQRKRFQDTSEVLKAVRAGETYTARAREYNPRDY